MAIRSGCRVIFKTEGGRLALAGALTLRRNSPRGSHGPSNIGASSSGVFIGSKREEE